MAATMTLDASTATLDPRDATASRFPGPLLDTAPPPRATPPARLVLFVGMSPVPQATAGRPLRRRQWAVPSPSALPPIVFSHGNGFPAGTYRQLFDAWRRAGHEVHAVERYGHDPRWPVTSNWPHLRDQLVAFIEAEVGGPALLVGHSLGGMLSVMAASRRPDLACGIVLLDSPVIAGWRAHGVRVAKATGLLRRISPGRVARVRRRQWPTQAAVHEHFAGKSVFARWDPRVLEDYVASGVVGDGRQWTLAFDREVEARIYETLPHHMGGLLARHPLRCPLAFVGGRQSVEVRQAGVAVTRRLAGERFEWTAGTHLFPMEHPDEAAALVLQMIGRMPAP